MKEQEESWKAEEGGGEGEGGSGGGEWLGVRLLGSTSDGPFV